MSYRTNDPLGGDLSGHESTATVTDIQGNPVQSGILSATQDGYVLTWTNGSSQWQARPTSSTIVDGQDYQFSNTSSDVGGYDQLLNNATGSESDSSTGVTSGGGKTLIEAFATAVNDPQLDLIPAGLWEFNYYAYVSTLGAFTTNLIFDVYTRTSGGSETLLFTATGANLTTTSVALNTLMYAYSNDTYIANTTRLVIKVSAQTTSVASVTAHFVFDGSVHASLVRTPLAGAAVQLGGDLSGTTSSAKVISISGSSPIAITPANLQWVSGTTLPTIKQATLTSDVATTNMTIAAQSTLAGASVNLTGGNLILQSGTGATTNGTAGSVQVSIPASTGTGLPGAFTVNNGGSPALSSGIPFGSAPALWVGSSAGNNTNFNLESDGSTYLVVNSPASAGTIYFRLGNTTQAALTSGSLQWATGISSPIFNQANNTTNSATAQNLTIQAQNATGTTSIGGNLILQSGSGTSTNGNVVLNVPTTGTTAGFVDMQQGGTSAWKFGDVVGGSVPAIYANNVTPSSSNYTLAISSTGSGLSINAPTAIAIDTAGTQRYTFNSTSFSPNVDATYSLGDSTPHGWNALYMSGNINFSPAVTFPEISQTVQPTDTATHTLTIQAQAADQTASTNTAGGNLIVSSGVPTPGGNPGQLQLGVGSVGPVLVLGGAGYGIAAVNNSITITTGTTTLTNLQAAYPMIGFGSSSLTGNCTIIFPALQALQIWWVDATGVTFNGHSITLQINSVNMSNTITYSSLWQVVYTSAGKFYAADHSLGANASGAITIPTGILTVAGFSSYGSIASDNFGNLSDVALSLGQQLVGQSSATPIAIGSSTANLTDTSVTVDCGASSAGTLNANQFILPASTLSTNRTVTLGADSAVVNEAMTFVRLDTTANTLAIVNGGTGGGTLYTFPASKKRSASFTFDGSNWFMVSTQSLS